MGAHGPRPSALPLPRPEALAPGCLPLGAGAEPGTRGAVAPGRVPALQRDAGRSWQLLTEAPGPTALEKGGRVLGSRAVPEQVIYRAWSVRVCFVTERGVGTGLGVVKDWFHKTFLTPLLP